MEKLTELKIKNLKPDAKEKYLREGNGFVLRVRPTGSKSFYYIYDFGGKRRRFFLGSWPSVSLADAREKHMKAMLSVKQGIAPHLQQSSVESLPALDTTSPLTIGSISADYLIWSQRHHAESWHKIVSITITAHLLQPDIAVRTVNDFKRRDALQMLDFIALDRPGMARTLLRVARGVFGLAVEMETIEVNPFAGLKLARTIPSIVPKSRKRVLSDEELRHVWKILTNPKGLPGTDATRRALLLILVTAQRPGECAGMVYEEIDDNWWTIPGSRVKNGNSQRVFLSPLAHTIIGFGGKGATFTGPDGITPIRTGALSHMVAEGDCCSRLPFFGLERWTPHDLRRTAATCLSKIGCSDEIIDAILNHVKKGIIGTYNWNKYDAEKCEWLQKWSNYLENLVNNSSLMEARNNEIN